MELLFPSSYFPPASYLSEIIIQEKIIIEVQETYPKQTIRNHCMIAGPNGIQRLTVPVNKPNGNRTLTADVRIDNSLPWQRLHLRSIATAYNKSPFYLYYQDAFLPVFEKQYDFLTDLNNTILEIILKIVKIKKEIIFSASYEKSDSPFFLKKKDFLPAGNFPPYIQVFGGKYGFLPDLGFPDLIFNLGPETYAYLSSIRK